MTGNRGRLTTKFPRIRDVRRLFANLRKLGAPEGEIHGLGAVGFNESTAARRHTQTHPVPGDGRTQGACGGQIGSRAVSCALTECGLVRRTHLAGQRPQLFVRCLRLRRVDCREVQVQPVRQRPAIRRAPRNFGQRSGLPHLQGTATVIGNSPGFQQCPHLSVCHSFPSARAAFGAQALLLAAGLRLLLCRSRFRHGQRRHAPCLGSPDATCPCPIQAHQQSFVPRRTANHPTRVVQTRFHAGPIYTMYRVSQSHRLAEGKAGLAHRRSGGSSAIAASESDPARSDRGLAWRQNLGIVGFAGHRPGSPTGNGLAHGNSLCACPHRASTWNREGPILNEAS